MKQLIKIFFLLTGCFLSTSLFSQFSEYRLSTPAAVTPAPLDFMVGNRGHIQIWRNGGTSGQLYSPSYYPNHPSHWNRMYNSVYIRIGDYLVASNSRALRHRSGGAWILHYDDQWVGGNVTGVSGSGTSADPWEITATHVDQDGLGISLIMRYSYVNGAEWIDVGMTAVLPDDNDKDVKFFHVADTYLGGSDEGPAYVSGTAPYQVVGVDGGTVYESFVVGNRQWDRYGSHYWYTLLNEPWYDGELSNILDYDADVDNAIGIQFNLGVVDGTQPEITYRIGFSDEKIPAPGCTNVIINRFIPFRIQN